MRGRRTLHITFAELRAFLLGLGFREFSDPEWHVFRHPTITDTWFVMRPYQPDDSVADYNLIDVRGLLDARGILEAEDFEDQFRKTPA